MAQGHLLTPVLRELLESGRVPRSLSLSSNTREMTPVVRGGHSGKTRIQATGAGDSSLEPQAAPQVVSAWEVQLWHKFLEPGSCGNCDWLGGPSHQSRKRAVGELGSGDWKGTPAGGCSLLPGDSL